MGNTSLRRRLAVVLALWVTVIVPAAAAAETLRIGYQKYGTLVVLKARGTLEQQLAPLGVTVQWVEFPGGPQLLEALNVGSLDVGVAGETPPVFAQAAGADLLYIAHEPPAPTSEAILVHRDSPIRDLAQLRGHKVALNKGSNVHYLLVRALESAGLTWRDIQPVYLPPADARAAFERGAVDAWAIWDPYLAAAQAQLPVRVLADATGLADNHQFYLARGDWAARHPQRVVTLIAAIREVGEWSAREPQQVADQVAPLLGLSPAITLNAVQRQGYGAQPLSPEVVAAQQRIADSFAALKLIPKPLSVAQRVWTPPADGEH
ncbi:sulfonate ABC transporter substrate-binding protein [Isoalcanivorax beigongshangi]|uniref:Sulfonate ABC transporter substrate-binding protein n=1 Tax=Isoalcanivorax beigongshangi TaxID=3238810 RepID=A0ABV4AEU1_9GAMM